MIDTGGTARFTAVISSVQRVSVYYKATTYRQADTRTMNKLPRDQDKKLPSSYKFKIEGKKVKRYYTVTN